MLFENHLYKSFHNFIRNELKEKFPELKLCNHNLYLSLHKYLTNKPEKYYSIEFFEIYYLFLKNEFATNKNEFVYLLNNGIYKLNKAYININEINRLSLHDTIVTTDEYDLMRFYDHILNHNYLKLIEGVYYPFIYFLAYISRKKRNKSTDNLKISNAVDELKNSKYNSICYVYDRTVRNAIAHNGITYIDDGFICHDENNKKFLSYSEFINLFDDLLDICNSLVLASKLFYLLNFNNEIKIPQQLMIEELQSITESSWWRIEGCLKSETINNQSQLMLYIRPNTYSFSKVQYFSFLTAYFCEQLATGFDRYFLSFHSKKGGIGWAVFNGKKLEENRINESNSIEDYKTVLIDNLIFYNPKIKLPNFLHSLYSLIKSFQIHFGLAIESIKKQFKILNFEIRKASIHRNGWQLVLNGVVVIYDQSNNIKEILKKFPKKIIKKTLKIAKKNNNKWFLKLLPLGAAQLSLFIKDYRIRKLENYGLDENLICTIQLKKIKRIKVPDIFGSTIENIGSYRFAWNKKWIDLNNDN